MYDLPYHKEHSPEIIRDFLKNYPFAFLTGCNSQNKPVASQVPLFIEKRNGKEVLRGHIMKNTDHHKAFLHNPNVLAVFTGRHTYVSGTWYANPNSPSTWNFMSVYIRGKVRFISEQELEDILQLTSIHFENHDETSPTAFNNLPADFKEKALKWIVGFEIEITEIETVFKLSQDRDEISYQNIIDKLKTQGEDGQEIAEEMRKRKSSLFAKGT